MQIKTVKDLFENYRIVSTKTRVHERGSLLTAFLERINQEREGTKYKPLDIRYLGVLLATYKTGDLHVLLKRCESAKSFSKTFWYFAKNLASN